MNATNRQMNDHIRAVWQGKDILSIAKRVQTTQVQQAGEGQPAKPPTPSANAGSGITRPSRPPSMNDLIRQKAGRQ